MDSWSKRKNDITPRAVAAGQALAQDRSQGEALFAALMQEHPSDGMVLLERGKGYESLGEFELAMKDYLSAEELFRAPRWKTVAHGKYARLRSIWLARQTSNR
jgi:tetratricopeptide (TPR) repeat protein